MIGHRLEKQKDRQIFRVSLIVSLSMLIILFYFFPKYDISQNNPDKKLQIKIYVSDIPLTVQKTSERPKAPPKPAGLIPVPAEETELPEEFDLEKSIDGSDIGPLAEGVPAEIPARPILEVYPDVSGTSCKGFVRILVLVDNQGKVTSVEILDNTTGSQKCLDLAIKAAKQTQWLAAKVGDKTVDSWVTKTYKFNVEE